MGRQKIKSMIVSFLFKKSGKLTNIPQKRKKKFFHL